MPKTPKTKPSAKPAKPAVGKTLVTLLLDRSGSMLQHRVETLSAINAYFDEMRTTDADVRATLVQFDTGPDGAMDLMTCYVGRPIKDVAPLTEKDFVPRGFTPLLDAIQQVVAAVEDSLKGRDDVRPVVVIQTDGEENRSRESTWEGVRALIDAKTKAGWEFLFMGAGLKEAAYTQSGRLGLRAESTVAYGTDAEATRAAFSATASNIKAYAEGAVLSTMYSAVQKRAAGDAVEAPDRADPVDPAAVKPMGGARPAVWADPNDPAQLARLGRLGGLYGGFAPGPLDLTFGSTGTGRSTGVVKAPLVLDAFSGTDTEEARP